MNVVHQYDRYPDLQQYLFHKVSSSFARYVPLSQLLVMMLMMMLSFVSHQYVDWVKTGDLEAEWADEPACRAYGYKPDSDMFKGKTRHPPFAPHCERGSDRALPLIFHVPPAAAVCDLKMKGGVTAAAACCAACDQARDQGCQAFTFYNGACFLKNCGAGGGSGRSGAAKSLQGAVSGYLK